MSLQYKAGVFAAATAIGNQDVTGLGFQPKAIRFFAVPKTGDVDSAVGSLAVGMSDFTNHRCIAIAADDNVATTNDGMDSSTNVLRILASGTPTTAGTADTVSALADGFRLHWSVALGTAYQIHYEAWGGTDITNVAVGTWAPAAGTGAKSLSGLGFQPAALMFLNGEVASGSSQASARMGIGCSTGSGQDYAIAVDNTDALTATPVCRYSHKASAIHQHAAGTAQLDATMTSLDVDGFTMNFATHAATTYSIFYMAIKGGRWKVGSGNSPTAAGNQAYTGVGFTPVGATIFGMAFAAGTSIGQGDSFWILGGINPDATGRALGYRVGNAINQRSSAGYAAKCIHVLASSTAIRLEGNPTSLDADGFTINFTTVNATAFEFAWLTFASSGSPQALAPAIAANVGEWTNENGIADPTAMAGSINDLTSDATWVQGPPSPTVVKKVRFKLQMANAPGPGAMTMKTRYKKDFAGGADRIDMNVRLYQGGGSTFGAGTLIASRSLPNVGAQAEDDHTLTSGEAALITDWTDLYVEMDEIKV